MDRTRTTREPFRARRDDHLVEPLFAAVRAADGEREAAAPSLWSRLLSWLSGR